jgi:hypothetical protein
MLRGCGLYCYGEPCVSAVKKGRAETEAKQFFRSALNFLQRCNKKSISPNFLSKKGKAEKSKKV